MFCKEKLATPCFHYRGAVDEAALNAFLLANGGKEAQLLKDGTAILWSLIRADERFVYLKPGSWLRVIDTAQFSALSNRTFTDRFEISQPVNTPDNQSNYSDDTPYDSWTYLKNKPDLTAGAQSIEPDHSTKEIPTLPGGALNAMSMEHVRGWMKVFNKKQRK